MFLSIIIPVYNTEKYLSECLDSIINQDFTDYEIILVDDGSTDSSGKICDEYEKKYKNKIKVVHKNNEGQLLARIDGVKLSSAQYCWFVDSDDFIENGALSYLYKKNQKYNSPDMLIFSSSLFENNEKKTQGVLFDERVFFHDEKKFIYELILKTDYLNPLWIKIIKKKLLVDNSSELINKFYGQKVGEDIAYFLDFVTKSKNIVYLPSSLYVYRITPISVVRGRKTFDDVKNIFSPTFYELLIKYSFIWGVYSKENVEIVYNRSLIVILSFFVKIYNDCENISEKKKIIKSEWMKILPIKAIKYFNKKRLPIVRRIEFYCMRKKSFILMEILTFAKKVFKRLLKKHHQ